MIGESGLRTRYANLSRLRAVFLCLGFMLPKPESTCLNPHQLIEAGRSCGLSRLDKVLPAHDPEKIFIIALAM